MTSSTIDESQRKAARVAGLMYLVLMVTGLFAEVYVRSKLIVPGHAAATALWLLIKGVRPPGGAEPAVVSPGPSS